MISYQTLNFERRGHIGIVSLNRPKRLNALTFEMLDDLTRCFADLRDDLDTRVVILRGEGRAFCVAPTCRGVTSGNALSPFRRCIIAK